MQNVHGESVIFAIVRILKALTLFSQ